MKGRICRTRRWRIWSRHCGVTSRCPGTRTPPPCAPPAPPDPAPPTTPTRTCAAPYARPAPAPSCPALARSPFPSSPIPRLTSCPFCRAGTTRCASPAPPTATVRPPPTWSPASSARSARPPPSHSAPAHPPPAPSASASPATYSLLPVRPSPAPIECFRRKSGIWMYRERAYSMPQVQRLRPRLPRGAGVQPGGGPPLRALQPRGERLHGRRQLARLPALLHLRARPDNHPELHHRHRPPMRPP